MSTSSPFFAESSRAGSGDDLTIFGLVLLLTGPRMTGRRSSSRSQPGLCITLPEMVMIQMTFKAPAAAARIVVVAQRDWSSDDIFGF